MLNDNLNENHPIDAEMVVRFGKPSGNGPCFGVNLQRIHDPALAERTSGRLRGPNLQGADWIEDPGRHRVNSGLFARRPWTPRPASSAPRTAT